MKLTPHTIPALADVLPQGAHAKRGDTFIPNEAAFGSLFMSEPLTSYAVGVNDQERELLRELEFIAPAVTTPRRFEYRVADNATAFIGETDGTDIRAIGATYKTVAARDRIEQAKTYDKGLTQRLDVEDVAADPMALEKAVTRLKVRLLRAEVYRAGALLQAAATMSNKTWATGTTSDSDPDTDLLAMIRAAQVEKGMFPSRVLFGGGAWIKRLAALRAMASSGGFQSVGFTEQNLADYLGVADVLRSKTLRSVTTVKKEDIISANKVFAYMAEAGAGKDDPSNIKRFTTPMDGGAWRVYKQEVNASIIDVTVAHYSYIAITCNLGIMGLDVA